MFVIVFYVRFLSDNMVLEGQFSACDYDGAMLVANRISYALEESIPADVIAYVSPVPFDD